MKCPKCNLINPDFALRCDCGYDFTSNEIRASYIYSKDTSNSKLKSLTSLQRGFIQFGTWIILSLSFFFLSIIITDLIRIYILGLGFGITDGALAFIPAIIYYPLLLALYEIFIFFIYRKIKSVLNFIFIIAAIPIIANILIAIAISLYYGLFN